MQSHNLIEATINWILKLRAYHYKSSFEGKMEMNFRTLYQSAFLLLAFAITHHAIANSESRALPNTVSEMRTELDVVNFDIQDNKGRIERLKVLLPHAESLAKKNKDNPGFQMMAGFYNAQYAGYTGGVGALKYAKAARKYLEKSTELDPSIYGASAHSVLGTIYYQVPGWPIGFGDKKKAVKNYQAALQLSPDGMDSNFTYGEYLFAQKKYAEARTYFEKAKLAPPRKDRPKADVYAHETLQKYIVEIEKRLSK